MSVFKTKGIILKINKTPTKDFLYTIFTKDYGKIICNSKLQKKEKTLDIGYIINFEISTRQESSIHKIRNIKISSEFSHINKSFTILNNYLILISIILKKLPNGSPFLELFELCETINKYENIDEIKLILTRIKIVSIFGELNTNHSNPTIQKILKFISQNKINKILLLTGVSNKYKKELEII